MRQIHLLSVSFSVPADLCSIYFIYTIIFLFPSVKPFLRKIRYFSTAEGKIPVSKDIPDNIKEKIEFVLVDDYLDIYNNVGGNEKNGIKKSNRKPRT